MSLMVLFCRTTGSSRNHFTSWVKVRLDSSLMSRYFFSTHSEAVRGSDHSFCLAAPLPGSAGLERQASQPDSL